MLPPPPDGFGNCLFQRGEPRKRKISIFCNVSPEDVISAPDITTIYEVPVNFEKEKLGEVMLAAMGLKVRRKDMTD